MKHDRWSKMGEENLGEMNIRFGKKASWSILMKAIINDHWADAPREAWDEEKVDYVMSKLYYVWCAQLHDYHAEEMLNIDEEMLCTYDCDFCGGE